MFSLREITIIRLCRALCVALCLAPACAVVAWCVVVRLPAYRDAHAAAIAARFGLHAQLDRVSTPRPGTTLLAGLVLSEPDGSRVVARFPFVELRAMGDAMVIHLPYPTTLDGARLCALWKAPFDSARDNFRSVRLEARNVTLHYPAGDQSFTDVSGQLTRENDNASLALKFHRALAGGEAPEPAELSITRSAQSGDASGEVRLATGATSLSCTLISALWPGVGCLGKGCEFRGKLVAPLHDGHWQLQLAGRLSQIDLDTLVSDQFPHKLSGVAMADLELAIGDDGRIEKCRGVVAAGPGSISRSLWQAAHEQLRCAANIGRPGDPATLAAYRELRFSFALDDRSLAIRGAIPQGDGALLVDTAGDVLLAEPPLAAQSPLNLARALVPQSELQLPATRETAGLLSVLPLPSVAPGPASEQPPRLSRPRVRATPNDSRLK